MLLKSENGVSIIAAAFALVVLAVLGLVISSMLSISATGSLHNIEAQQALQIAEAGRQYAIWYLTKKDPNWDTNGETPEVRLAKGAFTLYVYDEGAEKNVISRGYIPQKEGHRALRVVKLRGSYESSAGASPIYKYAIYTDSSDVTYGEELVFDQSKYILSTRQLNDVPGPDSGLPDGAHVHSNENITFRNGSGTVVEGTVYSAKSVINESWTGTPWRDGFQDGAASVAPPFLGDNQRDDYRETAQAQGRYYSGDKVFTGFVELGNPNDPATIFVEGKVIIGNATYHRPGKTNLYGVGSIVSGGLTPGVVQSVTATTLTKDASTPDWTEDTHIGDILLISSGSASGNTYTITDNDSTTLTCSGANLSGDGVSPGDDFVINGNLTIFGPIRPASGDRTKLALVSFFDTNYRFMTLVPPYTEGVRKLDVKDSSGTSKLNFNNENITITYTNDGGGKNKYGFLTVEKYDGIDGIEGIVQSVTATTLTKDGSTPDWVIDEHIGKTLYIDSGTAQGNTYAVTDNTSTTLACSGADMSGDGISPGDSFLIKTIYINDRYRDSRTDNTDTWTFNTSALGGDDWYYFWVRVTNKPDGTQEQRRAYGYFTVGTPSSPERHIKLYRDSSFSEEIDAYQSAGTVYLEVYADDTSDNEISKIEVSDYALNSSDRTSTKSDFSPSGDYLRCSFTLPAVTDEWWYNLCVTTRHSTTLAELGYFCKQIYIKPATTSIYACSHSNNYFTCQESATLDIIGNLTSRYGFTLSQETPLTDIRVTYDAEPFRSNRWDENALPGAVQFNYEWSEVVGK